MRTYFRNNKSDRLIVFFLGWALDEKPLNVLESKDFDVLFVYDYSSLDFEFDFSKYKKKVLVAFSYGVFMASVVKDKLPEFDCRIAINGTLKPIDKEFGIQPKIFDLTLASVSDEAMKKFYSKMFDNNLDDEYFSENLPNRDSDSCKIELSQIKRYFEKSFDNYYDFDKVIVSTGDKIIPTKSQFNFWKNIDIKEVDAGHFLFYKFQDFNEIIDCAKNFRDSENIESP